MLCNFASIPIVGETNTKTIYYGSRENNLLRWDEEQ